MKNLLLLLWAILLIPIACRQDEPITNNEDTTKPAYFQVFGEKHTSEINYSDAFQTLFEKLDSINLHKKKSKTFLSKRFADKTSSTGKTLESYIDFRFHSMPFFIDDDIWVFYPVIENNEVKEIVVAILTEGRTKVDLKKLKTDSTIYNSIFKSFQVSFERYKLKKLSEKAPSSCDYRCTNIEEVVIDAPIPREPGPYASLTLYDPHGLEGGGGCGSFNNCFSGGLSGGGGFSLPQTDPKDPCEKAKASSSVATTNSKTEAYKDAKKTITEKNDGKEHGVVFGNVNGQIKSTDIQTGTAEKNLLIYKPELLKMALYRTLFLILLQICTTTQIVHHHHLGMFIVL
ncbi:MAG: hypothetical protein Q4G16_10470 [Cruoricaptor ignavus]|nr:hypothetical protein [Cruoricaptor ignavus]